MIVFLNLPGLMWPLNNQNIFISALTTFTILLATYRLTSSHMQHWRFIKSIDNDKNKILSKHKQQDNLTHFYCRKIKNILHNQPGNKQQYSFKTNVIK